MGAFSLLREITLNTNSGSLDHWHRLWREEADPYATSWPDKYARKLELDFIERHFGDPGTVVEIGCGPFTIGESFPVYNKITQGVEYTGVDGSAAAISAAKDLAPRIALFRHLDLEEPNNLRLATRPAGLIISRRVLQNLSTATRRLFLERLIEYPHGILIEGTKSGLAATNEEREARGLQPLTEPPYNSYLTDDEVDILRKRAAPDYFMSTYYYRTRATRQLTGWNTDAHVAAYVENTTQNRGSLGPNTGFAW